MENRDRDRVGYPREGVRESGESETMFGIDGELGIDEEKDGLLDGVQSGEGPPIGSAELHLHQTFWIHVHAKQYVFVVDSRRFQTVPAATAAAIPFNPFHSIPIPPI